MGAAVSTGASHDARCEEPKALATEAAPGPELDPRLREFRSFVTEHMREENVPSLTIGFATDGETWVEAFGLADLENATPATVESAYRYASVQKPMTAVAVLQLVEQGRIDLDGEIQRYVPFFPRKTHPVTIRELLGHRSGLPHYVDPAAEKHITTHKTTREAIALFERQEQLAEPNTRFIYSSNGYNLLGAAIEGMSGQPYAEYMREHVWGPAGMAATRMDDPAAIIPNRVRGYAIDEAGNLRNSEFIDVSSRFAAGGTRGTVLDLLMFLQAISDHRLIGAKSTALMFTPMRNKDGDATALPDTDGYGMGWTLFRRPTGDVLWSDGGQQETRTFMLSIPSRRIAIAGAQNLEKDNYAPVLFKLYEMLVGERLIPDAPR